jgi:hypothetical protein
MVMLTTTGTRDLGALSGPLVGLSFVSGVAGTMARSDYPYPRPGSDAAEVQRFFRQPSGSPRLSVAGQAISAAALVRFTATVAGLAGRSGPGAGRLRAAAVAGGGLAAAALATSALCTAALTSRGGEQEASAAALARRAFLAGGPVHGAGFGVLVGALGLAGLRTGALPRPLGIAALASAAAGLLSLLYFVAEPAAWLIPIGRFSGLLVSGIAGVRLSRRPR